MSVAPYRKDQIHQLGVLDLLGELLATEMQLVLQEIYRMVTTMPSAVESIRRSFRNHGAGRTTYDLAMRTLNKAVYYRILQCFVIDRIAPEYMFLPGHLRFAKLTVEELRHFADESPSYELNMDFIHNATVKGDDCYAILDGNILASYGWYAHSPTPIDDPALLLSFDNRAYVYMYKGFTLADYRGQRLHAIGMTRALAEYQDCGFRGLVSYVESNNFDSIKSCYRMGYRICGRIHALRAAGRYFITVACDCNPYGLTLHRSTPLCTIPALST